MITPSHNARKAILADRIFDGRSWLSGTALLIDGNRISAIAPSDDIPDPYIQLRLPAGAFLAPGFVDLQVNGGGGVLLNDDPSGDSMLAIARAHRAFGTTSLLPTFITDTKEKTRAAIAAAKGAAGREGVLGLHLEGPFINPARAGVHRREHIVLPEMRDVEWLAGLATVGHSLITLAPELAPERFIRSLAANGIRIAAGHSEASVWDMRRAIDEGLTGVTHLFNAMPPMSGRAPGIIGTALSEPRLLAGIIVDGIHVDPVAIRAAYAAKGAEGIALVTDAMSSVGATNSEFELLGAKVTLHDGALRREDGTLAGAHLDMASAVRNAVRLAGIPLEDALQSASSTPASFLGLAQERGHIVPGAYADLVALDANLNVLAVWAEGAECLRTSFR
jgi:N-acetylglucosamine-6-phosphate deacetylase